MQKQWNCIKSGTRAREAHVFGAMENDMGGIGVRSIGLKRAQCQLALKSLAYNLKRTVYLFKVKFWKGIYRIATSKKSPGWMMGYRVPESGIGATEFDIEGGLMPQNRSVFR